MQRIPLVAPRPRISKRRASRSTSRTTPSKSPRAAQHCDHVDIDVYRQGCSPTVASAYQLGVAGRRDKAIAVYHDGSATDDGPLSCFRSEIGAICNRLFVFKWKNPEHWLKPLTRPLWQTLSRLRSS
jgi:hypothetical protein